MLQKWKYQVVYAAQRMIERSISRSEVLNAILHGEMIEEYPEDYPFPSCLIFRSADLPLHVVVAKAEVEIVIISVYRPDLTRFEADLKTRRK